MPESMSPEAWAARNKSRREKLKPVVNIAERKSKIRMSAELPNEQVRRPLPFKQDGTSMF
jgi:hypothetical protein